MKSHKWKKVFAVILLLAILPIAGIKVKTKLHKYRLKNKWNTATLSHSVLEDKPFVIVVCSFNNAGFARKNLTSILSQKYPNYRIVYIDDCSTDATEQEVKAILSEFHMTDRVTFVRNPVNKGAMYNLYHAISKCNPNEIVVLLDGDDWFAHDNVLAQLNGYYANRKVWMTYGCYRFYPSYQMGLEPAPLTHHTLKSATARQKPFVSSHLRTFYAGLFHHIRMEDLQYQGKFYPTTYDLAIMYPMIEMAREHCYFTPDVMYIYNCDTPLNDFKLRRKEQIFFEKYIRSLPVYQRLRAHPAQE